MNYESVRVVESQAAPGVQFTVNRMSFGRRLELMRRVRELARRLEFLESSAHTEDQMDAALVRTEIESLYLMWGLRSVQGLQLDGVDATPASLRDAGPEDLLREVLAAVRAEAGLSSEERKN